MENILILLVALAIDLSIGEYPRAVHPVVRMGKVIEIEKRLAPRSGKYLQLVYGAAIVMVTVALFAVPVHYLLAYLSGLNTVVYIVVAALVLKSAFAVKELRRVAIRIRGSLQESNLEQARMETRALVKRDLARLDQAHVVSATVESVAENTADSIVAPLLYFLVLGVPGAVAYRVVNTFDAMIGYRGEFEYLGKFAARLDDVLNFIPSRLSGLLLVAAAWLSRLDGRNAWRVMWRDHARTASPNAGFPMSAAAGALGVQLEKIGHYALGDAGSPLSTSHISQGVRLADVSVLVWAGLCLAVEVIRFVATT